MSWLCLDLQADSLGDHQGNKTKRKKEMTAASVDNLIVMANGQWSMGRC